MILQIIFKNHNLTMITQNTRTTKLIKIRFK